MHKNPNFGYYRSGSSDRQEKGNKFLIDF